MSSRRQRLAQRRKAVGFSQEGLAERLGIDRSTVARWEAGGTEPLPWLRPKLARVLQVSIEGLDELLAEAGEPGALSDERLSYALENPGSVDPVAVARVRERVHGEHPRPDGDLRLARHCFNHLGGSPDGQLGETIGGDGGPEERGDATVDPWRHGTLPLQISPSTFGLIDEPAEAAANDETASDENERWKATRQILNRNRHVLSKVAADLYWEPTRIEDTTCITVPEWMPDEPVDLTSIELSWLGDAAPPSVSSTAPEGARYRGQGPDGRPYFRYSQAIRALAKPSLFENRGSYRLLDLKWETACGQMRFGYTTYFDMIDVCELMAHELAAVWNAQRTSSDDKTKLGDLPFRSYVGGLFDLQRRTVLPSINTLTIRRAPEGNSFFLHRRGAARVAVAGGTSHVIPAGVFQPSGIAPWNMAGDFELWRSILREYSEEMLGNPEHDGSSGAPIDYGSEEPFRTLNEGRRHGMVKTWCFGVGIDPLVPAGEILTATVIDADVFDQAFAGMVARNSEGELYPSDEGALGIAWTARNVRKAQADEPLASAAAACIALGWKYRDLILDS